jgi:S-layer homology domain
MTIIITKTKLALAILAIALLAPAAALANNIFADVDDGAFYADPVDWAFNNNITTGKTPTSFAPLDNVTRGESVTFLKRYDDNIVQPALATLTGDVAANTSSIDALPTIYTARVNSDGSLGSGSAGVTASKGGTGSYTVDFPVDVNTCTWSATPTSFGGLIFLGTAEVFATAAGGYSLLPFPGSAIPDRIVLNVYDETGTAQDHRVDLTVIC